MCDYCEKRKNIQMERQLTDSNIQSIHIHGESDGYALYLRQPMWEITKDHKVKVRLTTDYLYLDINYCPFCGKKLVFKEREVFELPNIDMPKF